MRRMLAARLVASWSLTVGTAQVAAAQTGGAAGVWNDPRSRALVELATQRRTEQFADTGLVDYRADARGYVTFLAAFGDGFLETPKVLKTDQLALEVYWHAPNLSKQRIVGRRDTLLLPTDIEYHRDHLGIVQNNFPDFIRIGDGDEVRDVPHPLSRAGLTLYDYQLSDDSVRIRLPDREITLLEVKVRPRNDRDPRVIGAIYIDPAGGQVVRMAFNFTRAAFVDGELEDLAIVLENRLVGSRYWLPSRQEIEIRRMATWLDFPVRSIIRGRWEIGDYQFNLSLPQQTFSGLEIVSAPPQDLAKYPWRGTIMDSLPPDVRATVDPDIQRVLSEARVLVRAQALQRVHAIRVSAPRISDFVRFNRAEGMTLGGGFTTRVVSNLSLAGRGHYGFADALWKGSGELRWIQPSGARFGVFASRDLAEIGDQQERSTVVNSLAAQEFASDLTDPLWRQSFGVQTGFRAVGMDFGFSLSHEEDLGVSTKATPMTGRYLFTPEILPMAGLRFAATAFRPHSAWWGPGVLSMRAGLSAIREDRDRTNELNFQLVVGPPSTTTRASLSFENRVRLGSRTLVLAEQAVAVKSDGLLFPQELAYFGGPVSAPGYQLHSIIGSVGSSTRIELQMPIRFVSIPLGRFGRIPGRAQLAPFAGVAAVKGPGTIRTVRGPTFSNGGYPFAGVGLLAVFDVLRFDVARGLRNGRWMFNVDVSRDFWNIL